MTQAEPAAYRELVEQLLAPDPAVSESLMMGMAVLKAHGKLFAGRSGDRLTVKLGRERVAEVIAAGAAEPFDPSKQGRPMGGWASVGQRQGDWLALAREALALVTPANS